MVRRSPIGREQEVVMDDLGSDFRNTVRRKGEAVTAIALRNAVLDNAAGAIGKSNMHSGAGRMMRRGDDAQGVLFGGMYGGAEHAERLSDSYSTQAVLLAQLACSLCPLQFDCGLGPVELVERLEEKVDRVRFVARIRAGDTPRRCETNMRPGRLKRTDV